MMHPGGQTSNAHPRQPPNARSVPAMRMGVTVSVVGRVRMVVSMSVVSESRELTLLVSFALTFGFVCFLLLLTPLFAEFFEFW